MKVISCLLALGALFAFRSWLTHRVFNDTADEAVHIACGLEVLQHGRYTLEAQHPPLGRVLIALPAYAGGLRLASDLRRATPDWPVTDPDFYWRTLSLARLGNLIFLPFLLAYVYLWAKRLYGTTAGIAAAALASLSPNLLAHASLATLDFAAATTILIAAYHLWRWSLEPGRRNALAAGAAFGLAVSTKFSALFVLPLVAVVFFLLARRRPRVTDASLAFLAVLVLVWATYLFDYGPLPPARFPAPPGGTRELQRALRDFAGTSNVPAPALFSGVLDALGHNAQGHQCYLLGRLGQFGWWYYFPVALAVKTTIPLLLLAGWGIWRTARAAPSPVATAATVLAVAMSSNFNLGVRHILVVYPLFAVVAGGLFAEAGRLRRIALLLALWHAGESLLAHPDYLPYFNQFARGREDRFLLDSALDWGQDLERLRQYLEANNVTEVYLSYFGRGEPVRARIRGAKPLPPGLRPRGWVAASKAHIAGLALEGYNLAWLKEHTPRARVGKSILVYYFP